MAKVEPMLSMEVNKDCLNFLVDTGATYSALSGPVNQDLISQKKTVELMDFSKECERLPLTEPIPVSVAGQQLKHQCHFCCLTEPHTNLLGRDLLIKLGALILSCADGVIVRFLTGMTMNCSLGTPSLRGQWLLSAIREPGGADIYWGKLEPETMSGYGLLSLYAQWRSWVTHSTPYMTPTNPPHMICIL